MVPCTAAPDNTGQGMSEYGYRHLNFFFQPVVEVTYDGMVWGGRRYQWRDIAGYRIARRWRLLLGRRISIYLKNGRTIHLNGRALCKKRVQFRRGFWSRRNPVTDELISILDRELQTGRLPYV